MASTMIKSTYSLDVETVRELEAMARRWKVSKSEALRRAVHAAAKSRPPMSPGGLEALDELQSAVGMTPEDAADWEAASRQERCASSGRVDR